MVLSPEVSTSFVVTWLVESAFAPTSLVLTVMVPIRVVARAFAQTFAELTQASGRVVSASLASRVRVTN